MISRQKLKQVCSWVFCVVAMCLAAASAYAQTKLFEILRGKNNPVCHAYISALEYLAEKDREFKYTPWCEGNLNPSVEGFPPIRRVYITDLEEAFTLKYRIQPFLSSQKQFQWTSGPRKNQFLADRQANMRATGQAIKSGQLAMWRYEPMLDIDNDGKPDNVLGFREARCDSTRSFYNLVLIVDPASRTVDEKETRRFFADPRPYPAKTDSFVQLRGGSTGVFRYRGLDYIEAWGTDTAWTKRKDPPVTAIVYLRQKDEVSIVCEVRWNREKVQ